MPYDSNIYLVTGDRPVIVDAGTGLDSDAVISRIRSCTRVSPVSLILTHCHYDHAGGAKKLADAFGCDVLIGANDAPYLRVPDPSVTVCGLFGAEMEPLEVGDLLEGDVIDTGDHVIEVIDTPGHTPGGICLYDRANGLLISGDTLFYNGFGRTDYGGGSMTALAGSLRKLSNIDIRGLFPGHGNTCERYSPGDLARVLRMAGVNEDNQVRLLPRVRCPMR